MNRKTIAVLFGGQSSEHEISCVSATTVIRAIDTQSYDLLLIGITRAGEWLLAGSPEEVQDGSWVNSGTRAVLCPDAGLHGVLLLREGGTEIRRVDLVFPVLHGLYGEDGTIQGVCELARIPYVGCGVLSSAVSMDKFFTKIIAESRHVTQARFVPVLRPELACMDRIVDQVEQTFCYPVFVKPSNAGSSKGVSKARSREELQKALLVAAAEDSKILVEEAIVGRELECAVLQTKDGVKASGVGEILAAAEFYDYDAKYNNQDSRTVLTPGLPEGKEQEIRETAETIFRAVDGRGLARVDFFLENGTNRVVFNEINTLPGFTSISMYPMLWEQQGLPIRELVQALIDSAEQREGKAEYGE